MKKFRRFLLIAAVVIFVIGVGIQFVPYGHDHTNPAVVAEPNWDTPRTSELFYAACGDCHSNTTVWPWYSNIAPVSWLVQRDVEVGRTYMNVSLWGTRGQATGEVGEVIQEGEMPPAIYLIMHPNARLSASEKQELIQGLQATFAQ
jgi:cytochrome c551/c552